tara:strand:- start:13573 stop:13893 length:321 start_codon:yes stop_codon:yes gene_type:complete
MQVAEEAMQLLRDCATTNEEWSCMNAYTKLLSETVDMEGLMEGYSGDKESKFFKQKEERLKSIRLCLIKFTECYFSMSKYKEMAMTNKQESVEWQMKYIELVTKKK